MQFFPDIQKIQYEGPKSRNPLAFRFYNPDEVIEGRTMRDHMRFSIVYWHTMRGGGADPFGPATAERPWDDGTDSIDNALKRVEVAFEIFEKLQVPALGYGQHV
jgi:xylose isomerase